MNFIYAQVEAPLCTAITTANKVLALISTSKIGGKSSVGGKKMEWR